jgi:hypothetical protein
MLGVSKLPKRLRFEQKLELVHEVVMARTTTGKAANTEPNADMYLAIKALNTFGNHLAHTLFDNAQGEAELPEVIEKYNSKADPGKKINAKQPLHEQLIACVAYLCRYLDKVIVQSYRQQE